jgi:hypothetical protein
MSSSTRATDNVIKTVAVQHALLIDTYDHYKIRVIPRTSTMYIKVPPITDKLLCLDVEISARVDLLLDEYIQVGRGCMGLKYSIIISNNLLL